MSLTYLETINLNMFVVVPSAVFLALMGPEMVDLIYRWGAFTSMDSHHTSLALLHYSYGLIGFAAVRVTVPFFYAFGDSRLPMRISVLAVAINIILYYPMIKILDFAGLAAATSIGGLVNFIVLVAYLPSRGIIIPWGQLLLNLTRIGVASLLAFHLARLLPFRFTSDWPTLVNRLLDLFLPMTVAVLLYFIFCWVLRVREVRQVGSYFRRTRQP